MTFSEKELIFLKDTEFLHTKVHIFEKIREMFVGIRESIKDAHNALAPESKIPEGGKISKGENYRQLPYLILDFPAQFNHQDIFAFRTMFWWGHSFSTTLHLQGAFLRQYRNSIKDQLDQLLDKEIYLCVGESPWEYHYGLDNYQLIRLEHLSLITQAKFIKLSQKYDLENWSTVPGQVLDFYLFLMQILKT